MSRMPSSVILGIDQDSLADKLLKFMIGAGSEFPENNALGLVDRVLDSHRTVETKHHGGVCCLSHELGASPAGGPLTREELAFLILRGAQALMDDGIQAKEAELRG